MVDGNEQSISSSDNLTVDIIGRNVDKRLFTCVYIMRMLLNLATLIGNPALEVVD